MLKESREGTATREACYDFGQQPACAASLLQLTHTSSDVTHGAQLPQLMTRNWALLLLAAGVALVAGRFTWQLDLGSLYDDSVDYLFMAQVYSPWQAPVAAVASTHFADRYPPLFSLLLALVDGGHDLHRAHALVAASFAACVFLVGVFARRVIGSKLAAFAIALAFTSLPGPWLSLKGILSEFPYTALVIAALLQHLVFKLRTTLLHAVMLGLLLSAAMLTRAVGVTLFAAVAVVEILAWWRSRDRTRLVHAVASLVIAATTTVAWYVLHPVQGQDPYRSAWTAEQIVANLSAFLDAWLTALLVFWYEPLRLSFITACFIGICGLVGTLLRAARAEPDAVYVLFFLGMLAVWPYPGQMYRLTLPALPFLLINAFWLWQQIFSRWSSDRRQADRLCVYATTLPLALCVPATSLHVWARARTPCEGTAKYCDSDIAEFYRVPSLALAKVEAEKQIGVMLDFERIRNTTPENARVAWYVPAYVTLLAERAAVVLDPAIGSANASAYLREARPDYVYLASVHPRDSAHRAGDPLAPLDVVRNYGQIVWQRNGASGSLESALIKIDRQYLQP